MPNDAISREAAIEAVKDISDRLLGSSAWAGRVAAEEIAAAIASLPADTRWEELRAAARYALKHVEELRDAWMRGCIREHDGLGGTRSNRNFDVEVKLRKALDRLAPAPAEAQDVPKRPPMLLAKVEENDWQWVMRGDMYWVADDYSCPFTSDELREVNRDHSDPEALRLYLEDMAEAQD